jgi:hypothetical protein
VSGGALHPSREHRANTRPRPGGRGLRTVGLALLLLVAVLACHGAGRWRVSDYELRERPPEGGLRGEPVSERIFLVSDNQRHDLLGGAVEIFRTGASDRAVYVAIRPPQLDCFGQEFLRFALAEAGGRFVLHLGDACNLSTTTEFARFARDMDAAWGGWAMAPGNHDGFIFGNSSRTREGLIAEWNEAAESWVEDGERIVGRALQKDRFVSHYVAALILQCQAWSEGLAGTLGVEGERLYARWLAARGDSSSKAGFAEYWRFLGEFEGLVYRRAAYPSRHEGHDCPGYHEFVLPEEASVPRPHIRRVVWQIDADRPWRSYLTQELDISVRSGEEEPSPGLSVLVLDTSHYRVQPSLDHAIGSTLLSLGQIVQLAGTHGNLLASQELCALRPMTERMRAEGRRWIVVGHHPYGELSGFSQDRLDPVREGGGFPFYVSAHSHFGEYRWHEDAEREGAWPELNVGSVLDWPMEYRDLQIFRRSDGSLAVLSRRYVVADVLAERGLLLRDDSDQRARPGDPDYYLDYRESYSPFAEDAELRVRRLLLAAYLRMLSAVPTDHPDQTATRWPRDATGRALTSHAAVLDAVRNLLAATGPDEEDGEARTSETTRFLYELRDYDATRNLTEGTRERARIYRFNQALWAAREELSVEPERTAEVNPDLWYVGFPAAGPSRVGSR